jgi:hypothetical protein
VRGRRRGFAEESWRLVRAAVALFAGAGLFRLLGGALDAALGGAAGLSRVAGFGLAFGGAWALLRALRQRFVAAVTARTQGPKWRWAAAAAGAVRGLVLLVAAVLALRFSPLALGRRAIAQESVVGRAVEALSGNKPDRDGSPPAGGRESDRGGVR